MKKPRRPSRALPPVRPNAGIAAAYRRRMVALIDEMASSYEYWLLVEYRRHPPEMAMDAVSAAEMAKELTDLGAKWLKRIADAAPKLAAWFATAANTRSATQLRSILRNGGISVKFVRTKSMQDVQRAIVEENVALIKSIAQQYHSQVTGLVMRSVTAGRDLSQLSKELRQRYGITKSRANLIALDQNNKATSALMRVRQLDMGITEGIWLHSQAGKKPRPTHKANHLKRFSIQEGWFDPDPKVRKRIWPGQLIRCRCTWKPVVPGFS